MAMSMYLSKALAALVRKGTALYIYRSGYRDLESRTKRCFTCLQPGKYQVPLQLKKLHARKQKLSVADATHLPPDFGRQKKWKQVCQSFSIHDRRYDSNNMLMQESFMLHDCFKTSCCAGENFLTYKQSVMPWQMLFRHLLNLVLLMLMTLAWDWRLT